MTDHEIMHARLSGIYSEGLHNEVAELVHGLANGPIRALRPLRAVADVMCCALRHYVDAGVMVGGRLATEDERKRYGATHVRYFLDPQFADDEGVNRGEG